MKKTYTQCELYRTVNHGNEIEKTVSWIPTDCAIEQKHVLIKQSSDDVGESWIVLQSYGECDKSVLDHIRDARKDRASTLKV